MSNLTIPEPASVNIVEKVNALTRSSSRNELVSVCDSKNISSSGTKHDMALRIVKTEYPYEFAKWQSSTQPSSSNKKSCTALSFRPVDPTVIARDVKDHLGVKADELLWICDPTGLVFHRSSVIGRWTEQDHTIASLDSNDVLECTRYKFVIAPEALSEVFQEILSRAPCPDKDRQVRLFLQTAVTDKHDSDDDRQEEEDGDDEA